MRIDRKMFAEMLDISHDAVGPICVEQLERLDLTYRPLERKERDQTILDQLKRIQNDTQNVEAAERVQVWQNGWNEILRKFENSQYNIESLKPQYFRDHIPLRLQQNFVQSENPQFIFDFQQCIKMHLYETYLSDVSHIYEFGCGTGYNLAELAKLFPEKQLYGLDFVPAVMEILHHLREQYHYHITGKQFDIKKPDFSYKLEPDSAVCTFYCLEQVSDQFKPFLQCVIAQKPKICVHLEPVVELYEEDNLIDWLAKQFHCKRHYLSGFYPRLQQLEESGIIELLLVRRIKFVNWNHEGNVVLVWRPL